MFYTECSKISGALCTVQILDEILLFHCCWKADLISIWKKVYAMKWLFICLRDLRLYFILSCLISYIMIFTLTLKEWWLKREKCKEISASMV